MTTLKNDALTAPVLLELNKARNYHSLTLTASLADKVAFPVISTYSNSTYYEEITCVGYNPAMSRIEAVVNINQISGYNGSLCTGGSVEYVRFFVNYGSGFQDLGITTFSVHDIPPATDHPISYMVYMNLNDAGHEKLCGSPVVPVVRAILQWNQAPTSNPSQVPFFGNVVDIHIQLNPDKLELPVIKPIVPIADLLTLYAKDKIDTHRPIFPVVSAGLAGGKNVAVIAQSGDLQHLATLGTTLDSVISSIASFKTTGAAANTDFEELTCVGLDTDTDTLGAVIKIKRSSGYGGDLCHAGSTEFVAFWADWNNTGNYNSYLGTTAVAVHDLNGSFPADDLYYCVSLPVNVSQHLKACATPNIIRIRAVLSWASLPSTTDSNALNYYGNRLDTHVQVRPGQDAGKGVQEVIYAVGGVDISLIDDVAAGGTDLAVFGGSVSLSTYRPFGGVIDIQGSFDYTGAPGTIDYQVQYSSDGTNWFPVNDTLTNYMIFWEELSVANPHPLHVITQNAKPGGWFSYLPSLSPLLHTEENNMLAYWPTSTQNGLYYLRMAWTTDTVNHTGVQYSQVIKIMVWNTNFTLTTVPHATLDTTKTLDLVITGGDCKTYKQGEKINGQLRVQSKYFGSWNLSIQPSGHIHTIPAGSLLIAPASGRSVGALTDMGDTVYNWTIDTQFLDPCGYTLCLYGADRSILNSDGSQFHWEELFVGFSVIA